MDVIGHWFDFYFNLIHLQLVVVQACQDIQLAAYCEQESSPPSGEFCTVVLCSAEEISSSF